MHGYANSCVVQSSSWLASLQSSGKISSAEQLPLPRGQSPGQVQRYQLAEEHQVSLVHRAQIFLNPHRRVHLCLKGPAQARHEQTTAWSEIVTRLASAEPE